ncbi:MULTISPECIES: FeoB-associated Cys-rich membrane protein [Ruminococcus]|uniref:FeoB-associated Cys-rich membrane protein n=1 Tax=Ruminococcus TaxID=1263 RepID=UPI0003357222|nr:MULTISPECIES: FeoB-associated Cys-rich membrane protein [Ruminococcus]CDD54430.1 putative uncharacterized protein [Ruminococcus sp. CAG:379]
MEWFSANIGTILVLLIVCALVALVVRKMLRDRRKGKSSCGCNCGCCPNSGMCHSKPPKK